jgi:tetratricopeptide (TPR) repeat protein
MKVWLAIVLLLAPAAARAATADDIFALYAKGDYEQAAQAGEASHSGAGLAIAARAVLADEVLRDEPCMPCLERAEKLARASIASDPHPALGHVWLAVALGYEARIIGALRARSRNAPAQSKAALDAAVSEDPRNAYAVSALGGWNVEIVRGGGATLARLLYGATESEGLSLFDRAVKLAPGNVAVRYQIALTLAGFDAEKYRARITAELKAAIADMAETAYEKRIQGRAQDLLNLMAPADHDRFDALVHKYQGFP